MMQNDPNATAILVKCNGNNTSPKVHTNFFAIKPGAPNNFLNPTIGNAELAFTKDISTRTDILEKGIHRWIEEAAPSNRYSCRVGFESKIDKIPLTHFYRREKLMNTFTCPISF